MNQVLGHVVFVVAREPGRDSTEVVLPSRVAPSIARLGSLNGIAYIDSLINRFRARCVSVHLRFGEMGKIMQ